jgi:hypothetical protein
MAKPTTKLCPKCGVHPSLSPPLVRFCGECCKTLTPAQKHNLRLCACGGLRRTFANTCRACAVEKNYKQIKALVASRKAKGLCVCGRAPRDGHKTCQHCADARLASMARKIDKLRAAGLL